MAFAFLSLAIAACGIGALMFWVLSDPEVKQLRAGRHRRFKSVAKGTRRHEEKVPFTPSPSSMGSYGLYPKGESDDASSRSLAS